MHTVYDSCIATQGGQNLYKSAGDVGENEIAETNPCNDKRNEKSIAKNVHSIIAIEGL